MPAKGPEYLPGHYYHLYNRGAHKVSIFREADNYYFVLRKLKAYCASLNLAPIGLLPAAQPLSPADPAGRRASCRSAAPAGI